MGDDGFPSADEISNLANMEMDVFGGKGGKTSKQLAQGVFQRNAVEAAMTISSLAKHSTSETVKLRAAQYVIDRAMGPMSATAPVGGGESDPLQDAVNLFNNAVAAENQKKES